MNADECITGIENIKEITLVCASCGMRKTIYIEGWIRFGYELAQAAESAGWIGAFDYENNCAYVFCGNKCHDAQITKKGTYRRRFVRVKREEKMGE